MYKNLFYRPIITNNYYEKKYVDYLKNKLSYKNVDNFSNKTIYNLLDIKYENLFLSFRFKILREWIFHNEKINTTFLKELHYIIKILDIYNHLNTYELNYIEHYESINFCKSRNIKKLIVDFNINSNEEVWYRFSSNFFVQKLELKDYIICNPDIYLSNQRIIISTQTEILSIYWNNIEQFRLVNNHIKVFTKYGNYLIMSKEIYEIYVSVERISKIINISI